MLPRLRQQLVRIHLVSLLSLLALLARFFTLPGAVYAEIDVGKVSGIDTSGFAPLSPSRGFAFITDNLVPFLISGSLYVLLALSLISLIIGGIMWIVSGGDKEGLAKAKGAVTYALLGLVLGLGSFIILRILGNFFGVALLGQMSGVTGSASLGK